MDWKWSMFNPKERGCPVCGQTRWLIQTGPHSWECVTRHEVKRGGKVFVFHRARIMQVQYRRRAS